MPKSPMKDEDMEGKGADPKTPPKTPMKSPKPKATPKAPVKPKPKAMKGVKKDTVKNKDKELLLQRPKLA